MSIIIPSTPQVVIKGPPGAQGPAGPTGGAGTNFNWRNAAGGYVIQPSTTYAANDALHDQGGSWYCIVGYTTPATGVLSPANDPTHWAFIATGGAQGPQGIQGPQGPQGIQGPQGSQGPPGLSSYAGIVPAAGIRINLFGHSLTVGGGVSGSIPSRAWHSIFAGLVRGHILDQGKGGAILSQSGNGGFGTGFGGIGQLLQGMIPNPFTAINWRGPYNAATYYGPGDGVSSGGNWYRNSSGGAIHGTAPPGTGWTLTTGPPAFGSAGYLGLSFIPIIFFGGNDLGYGYGPNDLPFLAAMESALCRASSSAVYDANSPMISSSGGTFTVVSFQSAGGCYGSLANLLQFPNTVGAAASFTTPADWPGGWVDYHFAYGGLTGAAKLAFTVDGSAATIQNQGTPSGNVVTFGATPGTDRIQYFATSLTTALVSGVAVTTLAVTATTRSGGSGDTILVGPPGAQDTFVTSGTFAAGATSIPVTSHAPANAHPVNEQVTDQTAWGVFNNPVVRVSVPAGSHTVAATVQSGTTVAGFYLDAVALESPTPPPIMVPSLTYFVNDAGPVWPNKNQSDANTDIWNADLQTLVAKFAAATYIDVSTSFRPGIRMSGSFTAGQAGITSIPVQSPGVPYPIAAGDTIEIGGGPNQQAVTASAAVAAGATAIPVNSFTSTYAQTNSWIYDANVVYPYFSGDGIHPSDAGHVLLAGAIRQGFLAATQGMNSAALARCTTAFDGAIQTCKVTSGDLLVGTGTANAWGQVGGANQLLYVAADPGDWVEVELEALWLPPGTANIVGYLDIVTWDPFALAVINFLSGASLAGVGGTAGLGFDAVGGQAGNGLASLMSDGSSTTTYQPAKGKFRYIVQTADIRNGYAVFSLYGKSSSTTQRHLLGGTNPLHFTARNHGPLTRYSFTG